MLRQMILFIVTFFSIYGGVHAYAFFKARSALGFGWRPGTVAAAFMLAMTAAPFLIRALERLEYELAARALSYIAYLWMAFIFLFFCGSLALDLVNLASRVAGLAAGRGFSSVLVPARASLFAPAVVSLLLCVYGYFDAGNVRAERIVVETEKLPKGADSLTIAQISDVHLGLIIRCNRLDRILEKVKAAKPDLFLSTGDLVDAQINKMPGLSERLRGVNPKYGRYAITGNHEYYAGIDKALAFTKESGFTLIRNEALDIGPIIIAGVDDRTGAQMKLHAPVHDRDVLSKLDRKKFVLFLKHQPRVEQDSVGLFDLMLSGHTHKGQIWPFTYLSAISYPLNAGRYDLGKGSILNVSRGAGTWGPPIRFLAPPEVTIIEIKRKSR